YFPEVAASVTELLPERCVVDGEIVIDADGRLDFDLLSQRIHPAASRVELLAEEIPARVVVFDLLALGDVDLMDQPFSTRRRQLTEALGELNGPIHLTRVTDDAATAAGWFSQFEGAGLDGVVAK